MTYGCHNRKEFKQKFFVQDGWWLDGQQRTARVKQAQFKMASDCQYTKTELGKVDERCSGCKHNLKTK